MADPNGAEQIASLVISSKDASPGGTDCGEYVPDKFCSIINFVSSNVYDYIEECDSYESVIETLENLYIKTPNEIFARHQLLARHQTSSESLEDFLQELRKLNKNCNYKDVSAEQYREEQIRDAFISGINSYYIRQRLLENSTLILQSAFNQARSLDIAQRNSDSYMQKTSSFSSNLNIVAAIKLPEEPSAALNAMTINPQTKCIYCDVEKKVIFPKFCLGRPMNITHSISAAIHKPSLCTVSSGCPLSLSHAAVIVRINDEPLTALIDSCSSDNFIIKKIIETLKIKTLPSKKKILMALTTMESGLVDCCSVNLKVNGLFYNNVQFGVLENLCSDIILGYDFQKLHKNLIFPLGGEKEDLIVIKGK
ncbi:uncharacterized protein LOC124814273 [Hydra vulgaris]|uniref:uncharacterized protein LOC124814273 n=1 Tax=Hydra vulgaris TaxID=6087 RepID=UPI0032E9EA74